jgi:hypothetical protein
MVTATPNRLAHELRLYDAHKTEWLRRNQGQFVVIKGSEILGFFREFHEGYYAGVEKYGMGVDFLVKRVVDQEPVFVIF